MQSNGTSRQIDDVDQAVLSECYEVGIIVKKEPSTNLKLVSYTIHSVSYESIAVILI